MTNTTPQAALLREAAYDKVDRLLRSNLDDADYAEYSNALEALSQPAQPAPAEGGEIVCQIARKDGPATHAWIDVDAQGFEDAGLYPAEFKRRKLYTAPPASPSQAQQPSTQAWANETGLRQIECPSCGDLAVAYDTQQPSPATPADMAVYQSIADGYTKAQQLSGEVGALDTETLRKAVTRHALEIDKQATLEDFPEALAFQIEMARALLREFGLPATPKPEPMTWQPIETAPKDETFLAVLSCGDHQVVCTMSWPVAQAKNSRPDGGGFHVERVTHWMPLPPAPIKKEQEA